MGAMSNLAALGGPMCLSPCHAPWVSLESQVGILHCVVRIHACANHAPTHLQTQNGVCVWATASSPVIFLWWYLVLPTKLRLWQRTETTSSSLVQLRFHINKLKCILTVCKVNLPAFRRRLWHLLFRHLAVTSRVSMRTHPFWDWLWGFRARVCLQGLTASGPGLPKHECEDQPETLMKFSLVLCKITKMRSRKSCFP